MSSIISNTSTASLVPHGKKPSKDFSAAFASLQSQFGFGAAAPIVSAPSKKTKTKKTRSPVPAQKPTTGEKDWALAFSNLQSQYGFGGSAPYQATISGRPST